MKTRNKSASQGSKYSIKRGSKQYSLLPGLKDLFIGPRRGTNAKRDRPLDSKKPMHICFRSKFAKGKRTMLGANKLKVAKLVDVISRRCAVKIVKYANVGNHLHMVVKLHGSPMTSRRHYRKWIRLLTSRIAFEIGGAKKGEPFRDDNGQRAKFWDAIPFSRVIHGRRGWKMISRYVVKNEIEASGVPKEIAVVIANELYETAHALDLPNWTTDAPNWKNSA